MRHRTFFWFMLPSLSAMVLLIGLPVLSVLVQSVFIEPPQVVVAAQSCGPFGCTRSTAVDAAADARQRAEHPFGRFDGLGLYADRAHLAVAAVGRAWRESANLAAFARALFALPFYAALAFTLCYTLLGTPLAVLLGLLVALAVDRLPRALRGPTVFVSLLPMIVTPLVGSLILFWMIDARGVLGAGLRWLFADPSLSLKASPALTWVVLVAYGVWQQAPFAFIVLYAGLQTVPREVLEAAMTDGASRWERVRFVVLPHMAPLVSFVALIGLMDDVRVLEPIIGFSAEASATSLSYLVYDDLSGPTPRLGSAAATSVLTVMVVAVLLAPVLRRTWREFRGKAV